MYYPYLEIEVDSDGNLGYYNGDIAVLDSYTSLAKIIEWRLKTTKLEWGRYNPSIVADLQRFVGRPNTRETGEQIRLAIQEALTIDALITPNNLSVRVSPTSPTGLIVLIDVTNVYTPDGQPPTMRFVYTFDMTSGSITRLNGSIE